MSVMERDWQNESDSDYEAAGWGSEMTEKPSKAKNKTRIARLPTRKGWPDGGDARAVGRTTRRSDSNTRVGDIGRPVRIVGRQQKDSQRSSPSNCSSLVLRRPHDNNGYCQQKNSWRSQKGGERLLGDFRPSLDSLKAVTTPGSVCLGSPQYTWSLGDRKKGVNLAGNPRKKKTIGLPEKRLRKHMDDKGGDPDVDDNEVCALDESFGTELRESRPEMPDFSDAEIERGMDSIDISSQEDASAERASETGHTAETRGQNSARAGAYRRWHTLCSHRPTADSWPLDRSTPRYHPDKRGLRGDHAEHERQQRGLSERRDRP